MPPKRKAAGRAKGKQPAKKAKAEEPAAPATMKDAAAVLKAEEKKTGGKKAHKKDTYCPLGPAAVVTSFKSCSCMILCMPNVMLSLSFRV